MLSEPDKISPKGLEEEVGEEQALRSGRGRTPNVPNNKLTG